MCLFQLLERLCEVGHQVFNALEPHRKFRSGTLWLSNDPDRILLRAEVQVFVGYVFAELASFQPTGSLPLLR